MKCNLFFRLAVDTQVPGCGILYCNGWLLLYYYLRWYNDSHNLHSETHARRNSLRSPGIGWACSSPPVVLWRPRRYFTKLPLPENYEV
jgi:hypothetical protein